MKKVVKNIYLFGVTLPERFYPFATKIEGRLVRGRRSYELATKKALKTYGLNRLGYKLTLYREVFHFAGSLFFILLVTYVSQTLFGSEDALYVLLVAAIAALFFQEFYLHPKLFGQPYKKGIIDIFSWIAPVAVYFFLIR
jgi:hypothetical protein